MDPRSSPPTGASQSTKSLFRAFGPEDFVEWDSWRRLQSFLNSGGGCFGISGPRGAGKSWLMLKAVSAVREGGGVGTWYPSPSEYDPHAFLSTLSDNVANDIERRYSRDTRMRHFLRAARPIAFLTFIAFIAGMITLATLGFVRLPSRFRPAPDYVPYYHYNPSYRYAILSRFVILPQSFYPLPRHLSFGGRIPLKTSETDVPPRPRFLCHDLNTSGCAKTFTAFSTSWHNYRSRVIAYIARGRKRLSAEDHRADRSFTILVIAMAGAATMFIYALLRGLFATRPSSRLLLEATLMRERIRFSATQREGQEIGAEGGHWLIGRFRSSRERELVERPTTLSSLIHDFRALAEHAGEVSGAIVIAIDELDKMTDPDKVRALLRDIKGIFDVPRVSFLVSVSDEAVRALSLGALGDKNEFNSSFYTVLELPPVSPRECVALLDTRRGEEADEAVGLALAVLAGGNPRELLRITDLVLNTPRTSEWQPLTHALATAMHAEAIEFRKQVVATAANNRSPTLTDDERIGAFDALAAARFDSPHAFLELTGSSLSPELWTPSWAGRGWERRFAEEWRRLLVRLHICGHLLRHQEDLFDERRAKELQQVTSLASLSAAVAGTVIANPTKHVFRRIEVEST